MAKRDIEDVLVEVEEVAGRMHEYTQAASEERARLFNLLREARKHPGSPGLQKLANKSKLTKTRVWQITQNN